MQSETWASPASLRYELNGRVGRDGKRVREGREWRVELV